MNETTEKVLSVILSSNNYLVGDFYVISDYHLLDDYYRDNDKNYTKTKEVIETHNKYITKNDNVLYLGDLSGDEIYEKGNQNLSNLVKKLTLQLNHKNFVLITGNNDRVGNEYLKYYKECGFNKIYYDPFFYENDNFRPFGENSKILFSHEPVNLEKRFGIEVSKNILNIHGHIHGSKEYWENINPKNHLDVYRSLYKKPMRLSELIKFYNDGKYNNLKSVNKFPEIN